MKIKIFILTSLVLAIGAPQVFAGPDDLCVCQTGSEPREQVPAFIAGCEAWLNMQLCLRKRVVSIDKPLVEVLEKGIRTPRSLRLGYVGHWSSAEESVQFLKESVVPVVQKYDINVKVDNTACLAVDNPYKILKFLNSIEEGKKIRFKGNQAISTGMWDMFAPGKNNFYSKIDGEKGTVEFPSCSKFENRVCYGMFQGGESGVCHDKKTGHHVFLDCNDKESELIEEGAGKIIKGGAIGALKKLSRWERKEVNFSQYMSFGGNKINLYSGVGGYLSFDSQSEADDFKDKAKKDVRLLLKRAAGLQE